MFFKRVNGKCQIKKLNVLADKTKTAFCIVGFLSLAFLFLGGILGDIVSGVIGYKEQVLRIVIAIFLFGIAISSFIAGLHCAAHIWIAILKRMSRMMQLRPFISEMYAYCIGLAISLGVGFFILNMFIL